MAENKLNNLPDPGNEGKPSEHPPRSTEQDEAFALLRQENLTDSEADVVLQFLLDQQFEQPESESGSQAQVEPEEPVMEDIAPTELVSPDRDRVGSDIRQLKEYPPEEVIKLHDEFINVVGHSETAGEWLASEKQLLYEILQDRQDILKLIELDIAHYGPELYDLVMDQYNRLLHGSAEDRRNFKATVRVLYAAGITNLEQLRSFENIEQFPPYSAELLPVEKLWRSVRFQRYEMKDDPGISTGRQLARRNKQNLDEMKGETAINCAMFELDLDDLRNPEQNFLREAGNAFDENQIDMASDVRRFMEKWHVFDTNGIRNQPMTVFKEVPADMIDRLSDSYMSGRDQTLLDFIANKPIQRGLADAAGITAILHEQPILTPDTQLVMTIHGWHGDRGFGEYDIPPAMNALKKTGKPVAGIACDWWGINGNGSDNPRYADTPLTNKDLGKIVRRFMRMVGAEGNPEMFVLRMGWSRGGMAVESDLIEEIAHLERILGHALSLTDVQSFLAERCRSMDIISAPAEPGSEWFIRRLAVEENNLDRIVPLLSGTMIRVGHLAQKLGLTKVPGLRQALQKIIDTYTGIVLPPRNTIGARVGMIHSRNFGDPKNKAIGKRQSDGMIFADPLTSEDVRRLQLSTHLSNQLMDYGGKDFLIHAGILERNMAEFASNGYRRLAIKLEQSGHATPYETEMLYFPFQFLAALEPGDMNIIERYMFIQSRLNKGIKPTDKELEELQTTIDLYGPNLRLPKVTSKNIRSLRYALSGQFANAFSGPPEKISAIIQLVDYLEELQLHFPEDVSDLSLQEQIPATSLIVLDPYKTPDSALFSGEVGAKRPR